MLTANYTDDNGEFHELEGDDLEALAAELPEDYSGAAIAVSNEPGATVGWIMGRGDWRYA